jgi:HK97 gp10 family phage protein
MARTGFRPGDRERLRKRFRELPIEARKHVSKALEANGNELVGAIKRAVPVDEGDLRDSIEWHWGDGPRDGYQRLGQVATEGEDIPNDLKVTVTAGGKKAFYASFVEFGTAGSVKGQRMGSRNSDINQSKALGRKSYRTHGGTTGQPFFFPTYRAWKRKLKARLARAVGKAIRGA